MSQSPLPSTAKKRGGRQHDQPSAKRLLPKAEERSSGTLTFVTSEGESIVFEGMDVPVSEATALAGEEALGRIWDRPAEEEAWRDM